MSAIYPTDLSAAYPPKDPYFIGTLQLVGTDTESPSHAPPTYEVATTAWNQDSVQERHALIGHIGQDLKVTQAACTIDKDKFDPVIKWKTLTDACVKAKAELESSLYDLEHNHLKACLLKDKKAMLQQHIQAGLRQIKVIQNAVNTLTQQNTLAHLNSLQTALNDLELIRRSAATPTTPELQHNTKTQNGVVGGIWKEIKEFLSPVALAGWGLLLQSSILSHEVAQKIPFLGSIISFVWTFKNRLEAFIEQAKTGDQKNLIKNIDYLVEIFMSTVNKVDYAARIQATYDERDRNIAKFDATANKLITLSQDQSNKLSKIDQLEKDMAEMKQGIALLLKQANAQQSTPHKIVDFA